MPRARRTARPPVLPSKRGPIGNSATSNETGRLHRLSNDEGHGGSDGQYGFWDLYSPTQTGNSNGTVYYTASSGVTVAPRQRIEFDTNDRRDNNRVSIRTATH